MVCGKIGGGAGGARRSQKIAVGADAHIGPPLTGASSYMTRVDVGIDPYKESYAEAIFKLCYFKIASTAGLSQSPWKFSMAPSSTSLASAGSMGIFASSGTP